jgi:transcription termination/antitermination protein NusG
MSDWHALWTRSRQEGLVCRELAARHIEAFLPTVPKWSVWKDRKKKIQWPLFPGYCFARFDNESRYRVLGCDGVAQIVSFGGEPAPVQEHEIEAIRRLVASDVRFDSCPFIREGMQVEVVRGPLTGVVGRLVRKGSHDHLVLSVDVVNRAVSVQVEASDVVAL